MKVINYTDYEIDGIDHSDYPDYVDAFICSATAILEDGSTREATDKELDVLNEDGDLIHQLVYDILF